MVNKKELPILFNADMVNAILDGRKTQTRRVVKNIIGDATRENPLRMDLLKCPFGKIGDELWVRETFRQFKDCDECGCSESPCSCPEDGEVLYRANQKNINPKYKRDPDDPKWKPSIFMFRKYSRIQLEITDIRVERLNDISEEDAKAEGVFAEGYETGGFDCNGNPIEAGSFVLAFRNLWQSINGKKIPWDKNPYVWVVDFKMVKS